MAPIEKQFEPFGHQTNASTDYEKKEPSINPSNITYNYMQWLGCAVWPLMLSLPLVLSSTYSFTSYSDIFPPSWYEYDHSSGSRPKPLGLFLGIIAVAVGQVFVLIYFYLHRGGSFLPKSKDKPTPIELKGVPTYEFAEGVQTHLFQPEGFVLLLGYLSCTWMFRLMPASYYSFEGTIQYGHLAMNLILQDLLQYIMHRLEHDLSPAFYRLSHKPHHKFLNPRLFDAFNGSPTDTIVMILIPLYATAHMLPSCNVWTYMAFGSVYANWLTLIHSEFPFPWDKGFRILGFGTPGDHHVHHRFFKFNYGHLFMWFDRAFGTYRNPESFPKMFTPEV